jgi:hypothetical protein
MSDWAETAAQKANEEEKHRSFETERYVRDANIKDQAGPEIFLQLQEWTTSKVDTYNRNRGKQELRAEVSSGHDLSSPRPSQKIVVRRADNSRGPLTITYSPSVHTISFDCGAGRGQFNLKVGNDGKPYFETPYHVRMTIEEMGQEMLSKFMESPF